MKRAPRILAAFLAVVMLFLSGCSVFETKLARAIEKMSRKDNLNFELSLILELEIASASDPEGDTDRFLRLPGSFDVTGSLYTDPFRMKADAKLTLPGSQTRWECYLEKDEAAYYLYSRINDGTLWQKQGLADDGKAKIKGLDYIVKGTENFAPAGEELVGGQPAERFDGVIPGEYLSSLLQLYRVHEFLGEELGLDLADGLFDDLADVPASVWLDQESRMIVQIDAELGELLSLLAERSLAESRGASSFDTLGLEMSLERAHLSLRLRDFNEAEDFQIPDEARSAWGSDVMPWDT